MKHLVPSLNPINSKGTVVFENYRLTVFTSRLIRIEYSPNKIFEDRATQIIWNRNVDPPHFTTKEDNHSLSIKTESILFKCTDATCKPTKENLLIEIFPNNPFLKEVKIWKFGDLNEKNLKGTTRTLDFLDGEVALENGLLSRDGWVIIDDTQGLILENGWPTPRNADSNSIDIYFFAYGLDYSACLRDFRTLSGSVPLIPRYILGNWWSRFWKYSEEDIKDIVTQFQERSIPLSTFIIDMDWHVTETGNTSSGWTGYTWNTELFPEYKKLIEFLHNNRLKLALNIHPAEGIHPHECQFQKFAKEIKHEHDTLPIPFNLTDPEFLMHYFKILHHPYEEDGVDFWWIDWQQGETTSIPGLDPLWWLNHLHFHDFQRERICIKDNKIIQHRPFIFSRYGGLGSHRYPIGFSGDTHSTWASLAFQPYFTSTASNVGFGWWSHDIGGHYGGTKDSELYIRWLQMGVFSPIMRLHSGNKISYERLPWGWDANTLVVSRAYLQLRHAMIPYLYTAAHRDQVNCETLIKPLYYIYPFCEQSYCFPNSFFFGSEFLVSPFVSKICKETQLARQVIWLPPSEQEEDEEDEGDGWFKVNIEIFLPPKDSTHRTISLSDISLIPELYKGGNCYAIYGKITDIPLFVKPGAIIPIINPNHQIDDDLNQLALHIFLTGNNNNYEFYEDDGLTTEFQKGMYSLTPFSLRKIRRKENNNNNNNEKEENEGDGDHVRFIFVVGLSSGKRFIARKYKFYFYAENEKIINIKEIKINNEKIINNNNIIFEYDNKFKRMIIEMKNELKQDEILTIELIKNNKKQEELNKKEQQQKIILLNNKSFLNNSKKNSFQVSKLNSIAQNFIIHTKIQAQIIHEMSEIIENPLLLIKYRPHISVVQLRLLFEIIIGCGVEFVRIREGEELIILWNNNKDNKDKENKDIKNLRLKYVFTKLSNKTREMIYEDVPHFKSIQNKKFDKKENFVSIQYDDLLTWELELK